MTCHETTSGFCRMMYPRLRVLKEFLCDEGPFFMHIDDNELANAIILCDEIFGLLNRCYLISFKQASATGHKSINPGCVNITNNILIYAKSKERHWKPNKVFTGRNEIKDTTNSLRIRRGLHKVALYNANECVQLSKSTQPEGRSKAC